MTAPQASVELADRLLDYTPCLSVDQAIIDPQTLKEAAERLTTLEAWANGPNGIKWYIDRAAERADLIAKQRDELDRLMLEERDGLPQCWIVWAMKPGQDNPRVIAICTNEEVATRYEQATDAFPGFRLAKEQAPMNHTFGAADLRSVVHRTALRKHRARTALDAKPPRQS